MDKHNLSPDEQKLDSCLTGRARESIGRFCQSLPMLPKEKYPEALVGMGYQYESFDHMFALIACNIQATVDQSDYFSRYQAMQSVLRPFASEYAIEPERKLGKPHRHLYAEFYKQATGETFPSNYPPPASNPWIACGRRWGNAQITRLECKNLSSMDRAKYNLGYHWAVEYLSVNEFDQLQEAWGKLGIVTPYMQAHCDVEEEHAGCAISAVIYFCSIDDPLVRQGVLDHENDLAEFYAECTQLLQSKAAVAVGRVL